MRMFHSLAAALILATLVLALAMPGATPSIDKAKLEAYLRYAEGFLDNVHFKIDDPVAGPTPNFYQVAVHLSTDNGAKLERSYFMTLDGKQIVNGTVWDLSQSPFSDKLAEMPAAGYAFGPVNAQVKLVIFSDFECPYCRAFAKTVRENVPKKYPKDVRVVFEDFPLESIHPWARAAAEASHCVGDQSADAFWDYHDWIFAHSAEIKLDNVKGKILAWAGERKLDGTKLQSCMDTHAEAAVVTESENRGKALMIKQTPTSFANGRELAAAYPWNDLDTIIQIELKRATALATPVTAQ